MESDTLIPLPNDLIGDCLEVGEGKCDFPGCGKVLTRRGMGRHKAIHARKAPANPSDLVVTKLRERVRKRFLAVFDLTSEWDKDGTPPELIEMRIVMVALHEDLDVLGVI